MHSFKNDLPLAGEFDIPAGHITLREVEWGAMNVAMESFPSGTDLRPLFKGLPDDRCQCPHWGYVVSGRFRVIFADREELMQSGDIYYLEPGHVLVFEEPTDVIEFSPGGQYQETMEVAAQNIPGMLTGAS